jgi:hypothetical protein
LSNNKTAFLLLLKIIYVGHFRQIRGCRIDIFVARGGTKKYFLM